MNIQSNPMSYYKPYNTSFKGSNIPAKILEIIPDTKVCKNLRKIDKVCFQEYVNFKTHRLGITAEDIAELSKYEELEDFILASYELLTEKMGLSQEIRPALYFLPVKTKTPMAYSAIENIIIVDPEQCIGFNNTQKFSGLRHELQHYVQNTQMLRHETIAPKAINAMVTQYTNVQKSSVINLIENNLINELLTSGQLNPQQLEFFNKARTFLTNKDIESFNNLFTDISASYREQLQALTAKITDSLGVIKADSSLTPRIQKVFEEFQNVGYYKKDGNIDYKKYFDTFIENEAMQQQTYAEFEFSQEPCFVKFMKNTIDNLFNDKNNKQMLEDIGFEQAK